jgi:hypothetical protein
MDAEIAAKEAALKKEAAEIAAKELLAAKEQAEIEANEKKARDLAEKERLAKEAREKIAREQADKELADKQLADKAAADKEAKDRADKERADKETRENEARKLADSAAKAAEARRLDSIRNSKRPVVTNAVYANRPTEAHYVVLVLDKVDPVYASEARNAFNRYHREFYNNKGLATSSYSLSNDIKLLLINNFENATVALDYVERAQKISQTEIIPWLTAQKYSFLLISASNLEILKNTRDVPAYRKFLKELFPGKF